MKLTEGVYLHFIHSQQFKTQRIRFRFSGAMEKKRLAGRVLAANIIEVANREYPTPQLFRKKLAGLYGANFSTNVSKKGNVHLFDIDMSFLSPEFLGGQDLTTDIFEFIRACLFEPLTQADSFDQHFFKLEQKNLLSYLETEYEDSFYQANQAIDQLFYDDEMAQLPSVATHDLVSAETPQSTFRSFQKMLKNDRIDIFCLGSFDEKLVEKIVKSFKFGIRPVQLKFEVSQEFSNVMHKQLEKKTAAQSVLELAYHVPVSYGSEDYFALLILNGLLGEYAHAKLFVNIREKAGLAYTIASRLEPLMGLLKVYAGIDKTSRSQVVKLIHEQWLALKRGQITDEELAQTKKMLKNQAQLAQDRQINLMEQVYNQQVFDGRFKPLIAWMSEVDKVSKEDVKRVAKQIKLQALYFLEGDL